MYIGVDKGLNRYGLQAGFGPRAAIWEGLSFKFNIHIQIPLSGYVGLITQYHCDNCKLKYLCGYYEATVMEAAVAAEYPHSTFNGTPSCSSHGSTPLYETHVAGQEESGCVWVHYNHICGSAFVYYSSYWVHI